MQGASHAARPSGPRRPGRRRPRGGIRVWVNGAVDRQPAGCTLAALLEQLGVAPDRAATVLNGEIVARSRRGACALREGDRVDVLTLAGGG